MALSGNNTPNGAAQDADAYSLIRQSYQFSFGTAQRCELLDRAVAASDASGSVRTQFDARKARMECAVFSGEAELALALFAWCQRTVDDRPDVIRPNELLWQYKHAMTQLPKFARIAQRQIDSIAADMAKRFEANGASMRPVHAVRAIVAMYQGKVDEARALWDESLRHPRDRNADCYACELDNSITLLLLEKRFEDVLSAAAPIVAGVVTCAEVPHRTLPLLLQARYALGQKEEAHKLCNQSYRMIRSNTDFSDLIAVLVEYLVAEQDLTRAAQMAVRHLPWLKVASNDMMQERYARAVHTLLRAVTAAPGRVSQWRQQLLGGLSAVYGPIAQSADVADGLQQLTGAVAKTGLALAAGLDARNGNGYYQGLWQGGA
jgi:tetratricopeptide (TPR) repeat protein